MTITRRCRLLVKRGLLSFDIRRFFSITVAGRQALGSDTPQRQPWVRPELVSAAAAKDVQLRSPTDDRSPSQRMAVARMAAQQSMAAQRFNKQRRLAPGESDTFSDLDRMAG